jgi:peptide/nickel transport system substrate-binding protein
MKNGNALGGGIHRAAQLFASEVKAGKLSRREFLTRSTALGVSTAAAYGLLGLNAPARAQGTPVAGGTLRILMDVKAQKDPRTWDWSELSNTCRGYLEYLTEYQRDGSLQPSLLAGWDVNDDATVYTLHVRPGVTWNNGDAFTSADVAHNLERWADSTVEGNSMASRISGLMDDETKKLRAGSVEIVDDLTLKLNLSAPDISVMVGFADYPAAVVHASYVEGDPFANGIGTGPYRPVSYETGIKAVLERNPDHKWWGTGAWLDRVEFLDLGTDPSAWLSAAESGEVDMLYQTTGDYIELFDAIGMVQSSAVTASTIAVRFNQLQAPYDNLNVRRALQLAVNNAKVLELGYNDLGTEAENHHVCPIHPEYAQLPAVEFDPAKAKEMIAAEGLADHEFELISIDDAWQAATCDAVAAQIREAGINIKRTILPGSTFWNDWTKYPFSATEWNMRPLGVQVLSLAYKTGVAWNEAAFSNAEFDTLLDQAMGIADADARREVMKRLEEIMQEQGVLIQPYWRSLFRHTRPNVHGAEMHPTFEIHLHKYWLDA